MKSTFAAILLATIGWGACAADEVMDADRIARTVLEEVAKLKAADPAAVPMAFWDFDGTIIKGDITEGLEDGKGGWVYPGLAQKAIEAGLVSLYDPKDGWRKFWAEDYPRLSSFGRWISWPFIAQMLQGNEASRLDDFCHAEIESTYRKWYFAASVRLMRRLEESGVENYVISASPEIFVRNADRSLGLPTARFRGIRTEIAGGYLTPRVVYPLPAGEGKVENLRELVLARPRGVAVAAFGNSYSTDGAFLRYVATQPSLPGGAKGTAVMINGQKRVPGYSEHFLCVEQGAVVGP